MSAGVDVAVIGAGVLGCVVAGELADRSPDASVLVLDRDAIGSGASRRSAGLHLPRGRSERVRAMTAYSQDFYQRLRERDPDAPIRPVTSFVVAADRPGTYLPQAALTPTSVVPDLPNLPEGVGAWRCHGCQHADVSALAQRLARQLRPRVRFAEGARVTDVVPGERDVRLRLATGDVITADRVVLAPGPWLNDPAWQELVAPAASRVKRVVALHLDRVATPTDSAVIFEDEDAFLLPLPDRGHWLFSYTCTEWDVDPDDPVRGLSRRHLEEATETLARYAPELAAGRPNGRVFCDAYSPDGEPWVRPVDETGRVVFAGAANGSGYRLAPAVAARAVDLLLPSDRGDQRDHRSL